MASTVALLSGSGALQAQNAPPAKPLNSQAGTAGYTYPDTVRQEGPTYVGPIMTKWGKAVTPANAWRSYPRPQMTRTDWQDLNGQWDYAITKANAAQPTRMDGKILVPFPVESKLSGVARKLVADDRLWYHRSFTVPANWSGKRTLLHFGAVDFASIVWVNGAPVGSHQGGSDPFSFDITPYLKAGANDLVVQVADPTSTDSQPRGKQSLEPRGIWYTAVSGIWQTVWLEPVPDLHIEEVRAVPDIDKGTLSVAVALSNATKPEDAVRLTARSGGKVVATAMMRGNRQITMSIPNAHLWSPDDPFLYDLTAELVTVADPAAGGGGRKAKLSGMTQAETDAYAHAKVTGPVRDKVETYFGMRKIAVGPDPATGKPVMLLNNKRVFQNGTLDQGWWPDGLLTPPSEEAMKSDLVFLKAAGFNMVRKHIKVEPARYYYDADHMGMLIWQDMPSGSLGDQAVRRESDQEATGTSAAMAEYQSELARMIGALRPFPSIVLWVTHNEGNGQYNAKAVTALAHAIDPSRLVDSTSGWKDIADAGSDVFDIHTYDEVPKTPEAHGNRALVVGEYGGVGLAVPGHMWFPDRANKIYQTAQGSADYLARYKRKFDGIVQQFQNAGLSASVYTQTTDVEGELNGLLTYDRAVEKAPAATLKAMAAPLAPKK